MSRVVPALLLSLIMFGCSSEATTPPVANDAGGKKACVEGGKSYAHGATWKCSDGCNSCGCDDGMISSTTMACGCSDATGFHLKGTSWPCPDGCNTCFCGDDLTISSTLIACEDAGADAQGDAPSD